MSFFGDRAYPLKVHQFPGHFHVKKQSYISQNRCILYFSKNKLVHLANKSKPCYIVMQKDTEIGIMSFFGDRAYPLKVHQFPGHFHVKKQSYISQNRCILYFSKNKLVHLANKSKPCYIVMQKDTEIGIMSFFGDRAYPLKVHQFPGHFHVKKTKLFIPSM